MEFLPFIPFGQSIPEVLKHLAEGLATMHLRDAPDGVEGGHEDQKYVGAGFREFPPIGQTTLPLLDYRSLGFYAKWSNRNQKQEIGGRVGGSCSQNKE